MPLRHEPDVPRLTHEPGVAVAAAGGRVSGAAPVAGRLTGYAAGIGWFTHEVAETTDDLKALIAAAPAFAGPSFLVPSRNGELLRWCPGRGLRAVNQATLMTIGLYNESGAHLPSILYQVASHDLAAPDALFGSKPDI